ncbi:serine hydrolase [Streptomyces sp. NPDC102462]|uniref:serine hydrolase n=1 Tax=Streptomyces sp. NPDC102462 TaxID=3366178 RepID=UPI003826228C
MPHPSSPFSRPLRAARRGRRRAAVGVTALAASVAALVSTGALTPTPAVAATAAARPDAATADFLAQVRPQGRERVTAAVLDLDAPGRGATVYGADTAYDTASIIKVDILAALLLKAQDAGRGLTAQERTHAEAMIERSDNAAANALWRSIGRAPGLEAANKRLGLTSTQGGPGARWGLTRTTASDQIRLLRAVFEPASSASGGAEGLTAPSRGYLRTLMSRVVDEQSWGVSAAARSAAELKNGWLQRTTTGLWDVNSIGRVAVGGHHYLVAVLSDGSTSMKAGVSLVERAARTALSSTTDR